MSALRGCPLDVQLVVDVSTVERHHPYNAPLPRLQRDDLAALLRRAAQGMALNAPARKVHLVNLSEAGDHQLSLDASASHREEEHNRDAHEEHGPDDPHIGHSGRRMTSPYPESSLRKRRSPGRVRELWCAATPLPRSRPCVPQWASLPGRARLLLTRRSRRRFIPSSVVVACGDLGHEELAVGQKAMTSAGASSSGTASFSQAASNSRVGLDQVTRASATLRPQEPS